ncbi:MAG: hypothetical protein ABI726_09535 [bacterium]
MRRFLSAVLAGLLVVAAGVAVIKIADLGAGWSWVVILAALLTMSLVDREGFYGTPPHERH